MSGAADKEFMARALACRPQSNHLRMGAARALVPAFANHDAVAHYHAADTRIRRGRAKPAARELEGARHVATFGLVERAHQRRARLSAGGGASTSFSASRKSETSWKDR